MSVRTLLAVFVSLSACTAVPPAPSPNSSSPFTSAITGTAPPSAAPAAGFVTCNDPNPNARILDALRRESAYAVAAAGFTYVQDLPSEPNSPPRTRRARLRVDARYVGPDRLYRREALTTSTTETNESIAIGPDLWVRSPGGWQALPAAADPAQADLIAALVRDAGPGWQNVKLPDVPDTDCTFRSRTPVPNGRGYRELTVRAARESGLPSSLRLLVRDALDPFGNRHDSDMLYQVTYGSTAPIEPPTSASPTP